MSLSRNIFYTFFTQIQVQFLGILTGIFTARILGPEGKGAYAIFHANYMLLVTFFSFSINTALIYFISSGKVKINKIVGLSVILTFLGVILSIIFVGLLGSRFINQFMMPSGHNEYVYYVWIASYTILNLICSVFTGILQGMKLFRDVNKVMVYNSFISFICFLLYFFLSDLGFFKESLNFVLWILGGVAIINLGQYLFIYWKKIKIRPSFKFDYSIDIRPVMLFLIPAHLGIAVNFFNYKLNLWFLNYYIDEFTVGIFSLATNLGSFFTMVSMPIGHVLMPYLASEDKNNLIKIFSRYSKLNFSIILIIAIFSFVVSDYIIPLLYGVDYFPSSFYFKAMLPGILFGCQTKIFASFIVAHGKQKYNLIAALIGSIISLLLCILLIPRWGGIGAMWVFNFSNLSLFAVLLICSSIWLDLPFKNHYLLTIKEIKIIYDERNKYFKRTS